MENPEHNVVQPLPGKPRLALHGGGKRIGAWERMARQNLLAGSDVPSDIGVAEGTIRQRARQQRPEKKNKNDVANGRQKNTQSGRTGLRRIHQSVKGKA
jgi:hypothetical protein